MGKRTEAGEGNDLSGCQAGREILQITIIKKATSRSGLLRRKSRSLFSNRGGTAKPLRRSVKRQSVRLGTWNGVRLGNPDAVTSRRLSPGRSLARSSSRNEICSARSALNLSAIPSNDSLTFFEFDNLLYPVRSTETGTDLDFSRSTDVQPSTELIYT